ncbi:hypothetical protein BSF42_40920 [Flavobacterium sp. ACN6]|nr:hypothetical protein BSF42_40920 [Flavobacterium sp. ACN6]
MKIRKNILLLLLIIALFYLGLTLSWLFKKEDFNDIKFSNFKYSIAPFLSSIAIFIGYINELNKNK